RALRPGGKGRSAVEVDGELEAAGDAVVPERVRGRVPVEVPARATPSNKSVLHGGDHHRPAGEMTALVRQVGYHLVRVEADGLVQAPDRVSARMGSAMKRLRAPRCQADERDRQP